MAGVELALAIPPTIELCMKYGKALVQLVESVNNAEQQIAERVLHIKNIWLKAKLQLAFIADIWQTLDKEHQDIHNQTLNALIGKLQNATRKVEKVLKRCSPKVDGHEVTPAMDAKLPLRDKIVIKRLGYAMWGKEKLDRAIDDLEVWQRLFDPSWYLIMNVPNTRIDEELSKGKLKASTGVMSDASNLRHAIRDTSNHTSSIFLPGNGLDDARIVDIPFSTARFAQRAHSTRLLVLDKVTCFQHAELNILTKDVRKLATRLGVVDPFTTGLLSCYGVIRDLHPPPVTRQDSAISTVSSQTAASLTGGRADGGNADTRSFTFVFRTPEGLDSPRSLRDHLLTPPSVNAAASLTQRLKIATDLARAISFVHTYGFVHKNVRPETILTFSPVNHSTTPLSTSESSPPQKTTTFLVGFAHFRADDGRTLMAGDADWSQNLYRHPRRQGLHPATDYIMQHDIYSLGVCLLEIGLWASFTSSNPDDPSNPSPSTTLGLKMCPDSDEFRDPAAMQAHLLGMARRLLPERMGERFARVVETCLTCLDEGNVDFGDEAEFRDADGILVAVRYIEKILLRLNQIQI